MFYNDPTCLQVVISPHVYGQSISLSTAPVNSGPALWNRLSQSFGYLNLVGYGGHVFPIAIGEFGSTLTQPADLTFFADLASYLRNERADGTPVDALHNPISSFFWFAWNANSGDTGGLVNPPDWDTIVWQKIEYLQTIGLAPWYTGAAPTTVVPGVATVPTPSPVPVSTPITPLAPNTTIPAASLEPTPAATAAASPQLTPGTVPASPAPTASTLATSPELTPAASPQLTPGTVPSSPAPNTTSATSPEPTPAATAAASPEFTPGIVSASPVPNATTPATSAEPTPAASPQLTPGTFPASPAPATHPPPVSPVQSACSYHGTSGSYWLDPESGPYMTSVSLSVFNIGTDTIPVPWTVSIVSSAYTHLQYSWNWQIDAAGLQNGVVSGLSMFDWQPMVPGASVDLGYIASVHDPATFLPESISINGLQCLYTAR